MAIAIRSPNWIGDAIMSLPAVAAVHDAFPENPLIIVARDYLADLYDHIPGVERVLAIPNRAGPSELAASIRQLRCEHFTSGLLLTNSFHSALLFHLGGITRTTGYARDGRSWLLARRIPCRDDHAHHRDYYLRLAEAFTNRPAAAAPPRLVVTAAERAASRQRLSDFGVAADSFLIGISPAAAYGPAKAWPADRFRELIKRLVTDEPRCRVLLFGSEKERLQIEAIVAQLKTHTVNLSGRMSLRESLAAIAQCRLFVANDSGLMHAAAALDVPLVAIFGPTRPERTSPLTPAHKLRLLVRPSGCAPCLHRNCPTDQRCMTAVSVADVHTACRELLGDLH